MKNIGLNIVLAIMMTGLAGCSAFNSPEEQSKQAAAAVASTNAEAGTPEVQQTPELASTSDSDIGSTSIGGAVERAMDETDKTKMLHAMDKAPGKSTQWTNAHTQIEYTVTPTKKVKIEDKNYCRQYQMRAVDANAREQNVEGIACIASDGNWHVLRT